MFFKKKNPLMVRYAAVSGSFYPNNSTELVNLINRLLNSNKGALKEVPRVLIVPHAGYDYSGLCAASAYNLIRRSGFENVVLLGVSHYEYYDGVAIYPEGVFETPLGKVEVNQDVCKKLMVKSNKIFTRLSAHKEDHCLEVQIPFLQRVLPGVKIIPLIMSGNDETLSLHLAQVFREVLGEKTLLIASSDLSHYPSHDIANKVDNRSVAAILSGNADSLYSELRILETEHWPNVETFMCGEMAVRTAMYYASFIKATEIELLKYFNSGDVSEQRNRVVGYAAISFSKFKEELSKEDKQELLSLARNSLNSFVLSNKKMIVEETDLSPNLRQRLGAFVTLKKDGELRGCIGTFDNSESLYKVVMEMAVAAATEDTRFNPVSKEELTRLELEISVLSPLKRIYNVSEIKLGLHGVEIVKGEKSGVFLPQVAVENNWDLETLLSVLCVEKAGLPENAWQDQETEIYVFTADVFGENTIYN